MLAKPLTQTDNILMSNCVTHSYSSLPLLVFVRAFPSKETMPIMLLG